MRFSKGRERDGRESSFLGFRFSDTVCYFTTKSSCTVSMSIYIFIFGKWNKQYGNRSETLSKPTMDITLEYYLTSAADHPCVTLETNKNEDHEIRLENRKFYYSRRYLVCGRSPPPLRRAPALFETKKTKKEEEKSQASLPPTPAGFQSNRNP